MNIFDLVGSIRLEGIDAIGSKLNDIGNKMASVGDKIQNFGNRLIDNVSKPIAGIAIDGIKYNSTMEDLTTSFEVMLGSAEKAGNMVDRLKKMGAATPFETTQLAEYTKTMLAFGYTEKEVIPIMSRLGDVSLGNNEKMSSLTRTMGQINALGKLQGGDLNQLIGQGWNPLNEITKKTGETMEEVRKRMSAGKVSYKEVEDALISVTSKGGTFYQGMEKGSQTFSGIMSTLKDNFDSLIGEITKPLFDFIKSSVIPVLSDLIGKIGGLDSSTKTIIGVVAVVLAGIGPLIAIFGSLVIVGGAVISAFGTIATVISAVSLPIIAVIAGIGLLVGAFITAIASSSNLRNEFMNAFNFIKEKVLDAANYVITHFDQIKGAFMDFVSRIQTFVVPMVDMFINTIKGIDFKVLLDSFNNIKSSLMGLMPLFQVLAGIVVSAIGIIISVLNGWLKMFPSFIAFWTNLYSLVASTLGLIIGLVTGNTKMITDSFNNMWNSIKGAFSSGISIIKNFVTGFVDSITTYFKSLYNAIVGHSIIPDLINGVVSWFNKLPSLVLGVISTFVSNIITNFSNLKTNVINAISGLISSAINSFNNFKSKVVNVFDSMKNGVMNIINSLKNGISNVFNNISNLASNVVGAFDNIKDAIGGVINKISKIKIPSLSSLIPGFAGGVTNFGGGWAIVGENGPELVNLPKGSNVVDSGRTKSIMNNNSSNIVKSENNIFNIRLDTSNIEDLNKMLNIFNSLKSESITRGGGY